MRLILLILLFTQLLFGQYSAEVYNVKMTRGDNVTLRFADRISHTGYRTVFVAKASAVLGSPRIIEKTDTSGITILSTSSLRTVFTVQLDPEDTQDLTIPKMYYDITVTLLSDTTLTHTIFTGMIDFQTDYQTPYDGYDLSFEGIRLFLDEGSSNHSIIMWDSLQSKYKPISLDSVARLVFFSTDTLKYYWDTTQVKSYFSSLGGVTSAELSDTANKVRSEIPDTTFLSQRIDSKFNTADTTAFNSKTLTDAQLSYKLNSADTTSLSDRINANTTALNSYYTKNEIDDIVLSMQTTIQNALGNYYTKTETNALLQGIQDQIDANQQALLDSIAVINTRIGTITPTFPNVIKNLIATGTSTDIGVSWDIATDSPDSIVIYRAYQSAFIWIGSVAGGETTFTDNTAISNVIYSYYVKERTGNVFSDASNIDTAYWASAPILANTKYVSPTGNGDRTGVDSANAFAPAGIAGISPGDELIFLGGTYTSVPTINFNGTAANPIVLRASYYKGAIIENLSQAFPVNDQYIQFKYFHFTRCGQAFVFSSGANSIWIDSCWVDKIRGQGGLYIASGTTGSIGSIDSIFARYCVALADSQTSLGTDIVYAQRGVNNLFFDHDSLIQRNQVSTNHVDCIQTYNAANDLGNVYIANCYMLNDNPQNSQGVMGNTSAPGYVSVYYNNVIWMAGTSINLWSYVAPGYTSGDAYAINNTLYMATNSKAPAMIQGDNIHMINNIMSSVSPYAVYYDTANTSTYDCDYNLYYSSDSRYVIGMGSDLTTYGKSFSYWQSYWLGQDAHSLNTDPLFTSTSIELAGLTLSSTSPCIDAGEDLQTLVESFGLEWKDINGVARGSTPDIGAYEFSGNNWYVDRDASGTGDGTNWTDASNDIYHLPWALIQGGDTVYVSGGTDSTVYVTSNDEPYDNTNQISHHDITGNPLVITKGWESGHNGDVYFTQIGSGREFSFIVSASSNIKLINLNFITSVADEVIAKYILKIETSHDIIVDNCNVISKGNGTCVAIYSGSERITLNNCNIDVLPNTFEYLEPNEPDNIRLAYGDGGYTITNNHISNGSTAGDGHVDMIQFIETGSTDNLLTTIANNLFYTNTYGGFAPNSCIFGTIYLPNRISIYNNVMATSAIQGFFDIILMSGDPNYRSTIKILNNTIIDGLVGDYSFPMRIDGKLADTLIVKNNIIMNDSSAIEGLWFYPNNYTDINYADIDYNRYYSAGTFAIDTVTTRISFANWQLTGYDAHSSVGAVSFANIWADSINAYKLRTGSSGVDGGTDLSSIFTTDINGITRPVGASWDIGAIEGTDIIFPSPPTSFVAVGGTSISDIPMTWTDPADADLAWIRIMGSPATNDTTAMTKIDSVAAGTETYTWIGGSASTSYWFGVVGVDNVGNTSYYSNTDSGTTIAASVDAPTNINSIGGNLTATTTWTESGSPDSVCVFGAIVGNTLTALDTIAGGVETFTYSSMTNEDYWYFSIKAKKGDTWSDYGTKDTCTVDSVNFIPSASSNFATDGTAWWSVERGTKTYNGDPDYNMTVTSDGSGSDYSIFKSSSGMISGLKYRIKFTASSSTTTTKNTFNQMTVVSTISDPTMSATPQDYEFIVTCTGSYPSMKNDDQGVGKDFMIDNISWARTP